MYLVISEDGHELLKNLKEKIEEFKKKYALKKIKKEINEHFLIEKIIEALKKSFSNESNKNPLNDKIVYDQIYSKIWFFIYDKEIYFFIYNEKLNNPKITNDQLIENLLNIKDVQELLKNLKEITIPNIKSYEEYRKRHASNIKEYTEHAMLSAKNQLARQIRFYNKIYPSAKPIFSLNQKSYPYNTRKAYWG